MRNPLQAFLVVAGACLTGTAGCQPAAKPAADDDRAAATTPADGEATDRESESGSPTASRAAKPVTATRDERALTSLSAAPGETPKLGIGNLKRNDPDAATGSTGATVVEASKASSPLLQASSAAARAASTAGGTSSAKAPVRENMSDNSDDQTTAP
jgi:hypothetical protein